MAIEDFLKKPATKQDLIVLGIAMWLCDSGQGEKGIAAIQEKVRGLLNAAPANAPAEAPKVEAPK